MRYIFPFLLLLLFPSSGLCQIEAKVSPERIDIDALYNGMVMQVEGKFPDKTQLVLRFLGENEDARMKIKGKALGLLWMNMNTIHLGKVPRVCLIASSAPLNELGQAGAALSLEGVVGEIIIEPDTADRAMLLPEFLKLKASEGLYSESAGIVTFGDQNNGERDFHAELTIPSRLLPGEYSLEILAIKDGAVSAKTVRNIDAKLVQTPALIANLAFNHGAWYGFLATIIAILAGLGIGLVFQGKGAH